MTNTRVCVTVTAETTDDLRRKRDEVTGADLVELRLDTVSDPNVAGALAGRKLPVIVTCRPAWEGGRFKGSEEERKQILSDALARGAEYVDVEWKANFTDLLSSSAGRHVVISSHDFDGVPSDLTGRAQAMRATGAEVVKIAVKTSRLSDCLPLLDLGAQIAGRARCSSAWASAGSPRACWPGSSARCGRTRATSVRSVRSRHLNWSTRTASAR